MKRLSSIQFLAIFLALLCLLSSCGQGGAQTQASSGHDDEQRQTSLTNESSTGGDNTVSTDSMPLEAVTKTDSTLAESATDMVQPDSDVVVWAIPPFAGDASIAEMLMSVWQKELDTLLEEKGAGYRVRLRRYGGSDAGNDTDEEQKESLDALADLKSADAAIDLISVPALSIELHESPVREPFVEAVERDLIYPFDEDVDAVRDMFPTGISLHALEINRYEDRVQGVFQPRTYLPALAFNKDNLASDDVDFDSANITDYLSLLTAYKDAHGEAPYVRATADRRTELGWCQIDGVEGLLIDEDFELINPLTTERFLESYLELFELRRQGLVAFSLAPGSDISDFLVADTSTERLSPFEGVIEMNSSSSETEHDVYIVPDKNAPFYSLNRSMSLTAVASWSKNVEKARDFLQRLYEDPDFSNLIQHGVKGVDYVIEDGRVAYTADARLFLSLFGTFYVNSLTAAPTLDQEVDRKAAAEALEEKNPYRELSGFRFDPTPVQAEVLAMNALFPFTFSYANAPPAPVQRLLFCDFTNEEEVKITLDEIVTLQEAAGSQAIIDEFNRQLEAWRNK